MDSNGQHYRKSRVMVVIASIVLHGSLLQLPMPSGWIQSEAPEPEVGEDLEESGAIALITLPPVTAPLPEPVISTEPLIPLERIAELPPLVDEEAPQNVPLVEMPTDVYVEDILPEDSLLEEDIPPEEVDNEADLEPILSELLPEDLPEDPLEDPTPETPENSPEAGIAVAFNSDFPHLAEAQSGCSYGLENCRTVTGATFRDVARTLSQSLERQGYELTPYDNDDSDGGNHRIFEIRLSNDPEAPIKYLNIFGEGLMEAFYMITPEPITREALEAIDVS